MKTTIRILISSVLAFTGFGYATAQSASSSSREVVEVVAETNQTPSVPDDNTPTYSRTDRGIPTPPLVEKLMIEGKVSQALAEFEKFKASQKKANPFNLLYCEITVYQQAQEQDPANSLKYAQKAEALLLELIDKYPNMSDTYLLQIDETTSDDKAVELATKAIELEPENTSAYEYRGRALFNLGKTKEACADFEKIPWKEDMPEYWDCKKLR